MGRPFQNTFDHEEFRFLRLTVGIWVAAEIGIQYAFGILTNQMKEQFKLTQGELSSIAAVAALFGYFSLPAGIIWDRFGPKPILVAGALSMSFGFFLYYLAFRGVIPGSMPVLLLVQVFTSTTAGWMDIASLMTNLFNFPLNNGDVVILQKTFMGLGSAMVASFSTGWFYENIEGYCLFVTFFILVTLLLAAWIIDLPDYLYERREKLKDEKKADSSSQCSRSDETSQLLVVDQAKEPSEGNAGTHRNSKQLQYDQTEKRFLLTVPAGRRRFQVGFILLIIMMLHLTVTSILSAYLPKSDITSTVRAWFAGITFFLCFAFFILPFMSNEEKQQSALLKAFLVAGSSTRDEGEGEKQFVDTDSTKNCKSNDHQQSSSPHDDFKEQGHSESNDGEGTLNTKQYETRFVQSIRKPDIWLKWWYSFCIWGACTVVIQNCSVLYRSLNDDVFHPETNALHVAFIGLGSAAGRMLCGLIEQKVIIPKKMESSILYPIPPLVSLSGLLSFLFLPVPALSISYFLVGSGFGWSWATTVLIMRRMYKFQTGTHYNLLFCAPMFSTLLMNRGIFGTLYDQKAQAQGRGIHCAGVECVEGAILAMAGFLVTGIVVAVMVHRRWCTFLRS